MAKRINNNNNIMITNRIIIILLFFTIIYCLNCIQVIQARRYSPLIIEDDGSRRNNRPAECQFGKTLREIGSTWYADLGPPFGVMYCIKCECVSVTKKRRIVARVQCKNIKNDCPKITCDEPVQIPGVCCKVCPGDLYNPDIVQDVPPQIEEEERNIKHFGAILTGRTSQFLKREDIKPSAYSINNPQNIVATGRFTFHKKNLYYSFYISERAMRPRAIQFIDDTGHILEEQMLTMPMNGPFSVYQNTTGKLCGVWKRVSREFRRLLREEQINVVLLWGNKYQAELALAGKISKYPALSTELFSSLLEPAMTTATTTTGTTTTTTSLSSSSSSLSSLSPSPLTTLTLLSSTTDNDSTYTADMSGAGGTAIVSISSGATSSIHMTLIFNGLFSNDDIFDVPLNVRLECQEKKLIILEDIVKVKKPSYDYNIVEISSPIKTTDLRLLTRGKLILTIESRKRPQQLRIQGGIMTRVACELFQTLLAPNKIESKTRSSGLAWLYLNKDGSLMYNIHTDDLNLGEGPLITLIDDSGKRKIELEDITPSFSNNQAVGTIEKLGPRVLEPLYAENLAINVAIVGDLNLISGRLIARPVADARDSLEPILLKRIDAAVSPAHVTGMAWISVDNQCTLHYEITLNGFFNHQQSFELYLEEIPIEAPGAPVSRTLLEEFTGHYLEGHVLGMALTELAKLETSVCYLEIRATKYDHHRTMNNEPALLRGKLKSTKLPSHCFLLKDENDVPTVNYPNIHNDVHTMVIESKCYYYDRFYDDGDQFKNGLDPCTMCSCLQGHVTCETVKCPPLHCKTEEIRNRKDECCPTCMSDKIYQENYNTTKRGCHLGDQFHWAGATWHPYLPPNGFDICAICTCDPITLEINCPRVQCPSLNCSEKIAYRPDKKACCKRCPDIKFKLQKSNNNNNNNDKDVLGDQAQKKNAIKSTEEILSNGGCKVAQTIYENGQEWHPVLPSHGEQKCIKCRCKDTNITCDRTRCTRSICNNRISGKRKALYHNNNEIDECCTSQCRRSRRHHNQKRFHREQHHHQQQQQQQHHQQQHHHQMGGMMHSNNRS